MAEFSQYFDKNSDGFHRQVNLDHYNLNTNHPIIPSSQEYIYYRKYVSISSEDRDVIKFPNAAQFEIELPEDMLNVLSVRLNSWTFPANYNTFSFANANVNLAFAFVEPYNPSEGAKKVAEAGGQIEEIGLLYYRIFEALLFGQGSPFSVTIEEGFYNPAQMCIELTNKMNYAVTQRLLAYFTEKGYQDSVEELQQLGGYNCFVVTYNAITQKVWFGNTTDRFVLLNKSVAERNVRYDELYCGARSQLPEYTNWGLPANLGLNRFDETSTDGNEEATASGANPSTAFYNGIIVPRFWYGDVNPGDNGYWLLPNPALPGSKVYWVECKNKINIMGYANLYMEIEGLNCIDETSPFNATNFTAKTNQTNGVVNSSFCKMSIPTTPLSQWFDRDSSPYKLFYPPAERIRRLKIRIRYHNNQLADFGVFNYSFMLEFTQTVATQLRKMHAKLEPPQK